ILALIFLAIIMSTQFSFGRFFGAILESAKDGTIRAVDSFHAWREERRREKQRRDVIAKHTKKGAVIPEVKKPASAMGEGARGKATRAEEAQSSRSDDDSKAAPAAPESRGAVAEVRSALSEARNAVARGFGRPATDPQDEEAATPRAGGSPWSAKAP